MEMFTCIKMDLALNNQKCLMWHKIKPKQTKWRVRHRGAIRKNSSLLTKFNLVVVQGRKNGPPSEKTTY